MDYDYYDEPSPWGFGSLGPLEAWQEMHEQELMKLLKAAEKRMSFIGFYENKEKSCDALHAKRKTRLQKRVRGVPLKTRTNQKSK